MWDLLAFLSFGVLRTEAKRHRDRTAILETPFKDLDKRNTYASIL